MKKVQAGIDPLSMLIKKPKKKKPVEEKKPEPPKQEEKKENFDITRRKSYIEEVENFAFLKKFYKDTDFIRTNGGLLPCEQLENFEKASYKNDDPSAVGILILSKYRLIFKFQDESQIPKLKVSNSNLTIPLFHIAKISKDDKRFRGAYAIILSLKDSREITFLIWNKDNLKFFGDLSVLAFQKDPKNFFSFSYEYLQYIKKRKNFVYGWDLYNAKSEYERMGITEDDPLFRYTYSNMTYSLCPTYPEILVVPRNITDSELSNAVISREKGRLPVLAYLYSKNGMKGSIWRCSELRTGTTYFSGNNGGPKLLNEICNINKRAFLFSIKPSLSAISIKLKGKKVIENYEDIPSIINIECEIDDISKIRNSFNKFFIFAQSSEM